MKFTHQLSNNDCLIACICSLLEIDIQTVPKFDHIKDTPKWWEEIFKWLRFYGYALVFLKDLPDESLYPKDLITIASGVSAYDPEKKRYHSVLWCDGKVLFDPKKENLGIIGEPKEYIAIIEIFSVNSIENTDSEKYQLKSIKDCKIFLGMCSEQQEVKDNPKILEYYKSIYNYLDRIEGKGGSNKGSVYNVRVQ